MYIKNPVCVCFAFAFVANCLKRSKNIYNSSFWCSTLSSSSSPSCKTRKKIQRWIIKKSTKKQINTDKKGTKDSKVKTRRLRANEWTINSDLHGWTGTIWASTFNESTQALQCSFAIEFNNLSLQVYQSRNDWKQTLIERGKGKEKNRKKIH